MPGTIADGSTDGPAPSGGWRTATVREVEHPTPHGVALRLEVADRVEHLAGQHYVVRLRSRDGYTAQRSYSVASPPSRPLVELFVERLEDGEVSTFLADVVRPGDTLEVRGPIGGWFVWRGTTRAVGIGGGTGVVPLVAMSRLAGDLGAHRLLDLVVAARTRAELPYADELHSAGATVALSREPDGDARSPGRLSAADLRPHVGAGATYYVCGSAGFAQGVTDLLLELGVAAADVRVERFGPSG